MIIKNTKHEVSCNDLIECQREATGQNAWFLAGRTLNACNWHLSHAFALASTDHLELSVALINSLLGFANGLDCPSLHGQLLSGRDDIRTSYRTEGHFDTLTEIVEQFRESDSSAEVYQKEIYRRLVGRHVDALRDALRNHAGPHSLDVSRLGDTLDQGLRRRDVCSHLFSGSASENRPQESESWRVLVNQSREPGELPPASHWIDELIGVWKKVGLDMSPLDKLEESKNWAHSVGDLHKHCLAVLKMNDIRWRLRDGELKPRWCEESSRLYVDDVILKDFTRTAAKNQSRILAVFQEEGWPPEIWDPLDGDETDPVERLRNTVRDLNRSLKQPLIIFGVAQEGEGISWRAVLN